MRLITAMNLCPFMVRWPLGRDIEGTLLAQRSRVHPEGDLSVRVVGASRTGSAQSAAHGGFRLAAGRALGLPTLL
jgi:hypothetical protein